MSMRAGMKKGVAVIARRRPLASDFEV